MLTAFQRKPNGAWIEVYAQSMDYIGSHLSSLRQEITDLRNMNALHAQRGERSPLQQTAYEVRATRLLQIKQELSKMLNRPEEGSAVWWDKSRKATPAA
jgi:hypothetical protein